MSIMLENSRLLRTPSGPAKVVEFGAGFSQSGENALARPDGGVGGVPVVGGVGVGVGDGAAAVRMSMLWE
jgi:hypothetical protein